MASVSGSINFNEARKAAPDIQRRLYGLPCWFWQLVWAAVALPLLVALMFAWDHIPWGAISVSIPGIDLWDGERWIDRRAHDAYWIVSNSLFVLALWIPLVLLTAKIPTRARLRHLRKALSERGASLPCPVSFTITAQAFVLDDEGVVTTVPWRWVSEVFLSHGYWVFLVPIAHMIVPRRFFADTEAEHAFIAEALSYMSQEARARSKAAVNFASAGRS